MIIKFFDGSEVHVDDERGESIKNLVSSGAEWFDLDDEYIRVASISGIKKDTPVDISSTKMIGGAVYKGLQVAPTTELTDEQRMKNLIHIQRMKQQFLKRKRA